MAWNTGSSSPGELLITPSTSEVAVCCSKDSLSSVVRSRNSFSNRAFSIAMTAWLANCDQRNLFVGDGAHVPAIYADLAEHLRGRGLLLQRFAEFSGAIAQLVEQPGVLNRDDGLFRKVRDQRNLLLGEPSDLPAIDGNQADDLVLLEHRYDEQRPDPGEFDVGNRQRIAVEVNLIRTQVSDMDRLPCPRRPGDRAIWSGTQHSAPHLLDKC